MTPCIICNKPITDQPAYAKTHAGACRKARRRQKERERYQKHAKAPRVCAAPGCDNSFTPNSNNSRYCQPACARRTQYLRQKERRTYPTTETTIRYDRKPDLAVFLAKRHGDFPQARAYVAAHPELIAA